MSLKPFPTDAELLLGLFVMANQLEADGLPNAALYMRTAAERIQKLEEGLRPFAKAAAGVEAFDPEFPMEGAALRASFDWYDKAQGGSLKRDSVRRADIERARALLGGDQ